MQITIDTSKPLSPEDRELIALLIGVDSKREVVTEPAATPAPAKVAPKPAAKPATKPAPKPEPVEEPEAEEDEDLLGEDAVTKEQVVDLVTSLAASGKGREVKKILTDHKAGKVSELTEEQYPSVFAALQAI